MQATILDGSGGASIEALNAEATSVNKWEHAGWIVGSKEAKRDGSPNNCPGEGAIRGSKQMDEVLHDMSSAGA